MSSRLKVAIIGSGPSGFYAAEALLKSDFPIDVHMFDRLPTPFGLVRSGVAPDHPKLKQVVKIFEKIAENPNFEFFGNVKVGLNVSIESLNKYYHSVVFAIGAETDRSLNIPGESLPGSHTATEFVGWYNGHPAHQHHQFDLSHEKCVIIGQGNVTADVCRILAKDITELEKTDITQNAIDVLSKSKIKEIHIVGRRGPAQTKFSNKELRELSELKGCKIIIDPVDLELNEESEVELTDKVNKDNILNVNLFRKLTTDAVRTDSHKACHFHFLKSPTEILGDTEVTGIKLTKNKLSGKAFSQAAEALEESENLNCGLIFRSVGYKGVSLPGVPFDQQKAIIPNQSGRVISDGTHLSGLYATGWIKRGPSGIIGTNRADSIETVNALLADLPELMKKEVIPEMDILFKEIVNKTSNIISYSDWLNIDQLEIKKGLLKQKPREKITKISELLKVAIGA